MSKKKQFTFKTAQGIEYKVIWKAPHYKYNADGLCDDPREPKPRIWIDPNLEDYRFIEIVCHEIAHAFFFEKTEKEITKFARTVKRALKNRFN